VVVLPQGKESIENLLFPRLSAAMSGEDNAPAAETFDNAPAAEAPQTVDNAPAAEAAAPQEPQASTADAIGEVSQLPETLHMAARAGSVESVQMLLRNKADPETKDKDGKTPLQYAEEAGKADIVACLKEALPKTEENPNMEFEAPDSPAATKPVEESPPKSAKAAVILDVGEDALDQAIKENIQFMEEPTQGNNSPPRSPGVKSPGSNLGADKDLKARTMFSQSTTDGVLKRTTFIHKLSTYPSAPEFSIATKGESMFLRSAQGPSPGSYNLPDDDKSKFKSSGKFSFGGSSRFGLGQAPSKMQPGPGAYNPKDPALNVDTKVGFGTSVRNKLGQGQAAPGPGAYEQRSTVGGGLMFTARGRHPTSYMRSRSLPGPGAYTPSINGAYQTSPKCGFGTSTRVEMGGRMGRGQPGPGTYEMQNFKCTGKDSAKYSATSRRRVHDLNSYVTPGPGTYNAHATSFGNPGRASNSHVDENYIQRNNLATTA